MGFRGPGSPSGPPQPQITSWKHDLTGDLFPDAYQPFALASVAWNWAWLDPRTVDMGPYFRRRGLVFVDGKPLEPMEQLRELAMPHFQPEPVFTTAPVAQNGLPPRRRGGPTSGDLVTATDQNGNATNFSYTATGLLLQATDPLGNVTAITYDSSANPVSVTDALGNVTKATFDGVLKAGLDHRSSAPSLKDYIRQPRPRSFRA